jgi:predicted Ser/Thr protein kinase
VQFDRNNLIGKGRYGVVFRGTFKGEEVAVKRVQRMDSRTSNDREVLNNQQLLNHPNIVMLKHYEEDEDFR